MNKQEIKRHVSDFIKSIGQLLRGGRSITFYFNTIDFSDSLLALFYMLCVFLRIPVARDGRKRLSEIIKKGFNAKAVYLFGSARSGLYALLKTLRLDQGSEVIITGFTCEVVSNAVIQAGLKPIYADINPSTFCMEPESLKQSITDKSSVLIIQHTFGIPADIDTLIEIAKKHDLYVIEDCAVSLGSRYKGRPTGTFGDAAIFSFELSKTITACRGGLLILNSDKKQIIEAMERFHRDVPEQNILYSSKLLLQLGLSGILYKPYMHMVGKYLIAILFKSGIFSESTTDLERDGKMPPDYLLKLSNAQANILIRQWKKLPFIFQRSKEIATFYDCKLNGERKIQAPLIENYAIPNLIRYPILVENRTKWIRLFQENGVEPGLWFTAPISSPATNHAKCCYEYGSCPKAEWVSDRIFNLPTHLQLQKEDMDRIFYLCLKASRS